MISRRFTLSALAAAPLTGLMTGLMTGPVLAQATLSAATAKDFVEQSGQKLVGIVNSQAPEAKKADELRGLVNQIVAVDQVGDYVLGRYLHIATPAQHQEFQKLFHKLLAYNITYQIRAYQGVSFSVDGVAPQGQDMVVNTVVTTPGHAPADVGWAVDEVNGKPQIVDVIVAGTSLRITTRNDYASVITGHGGQVSALLTAMKAQIARIDAS